MIQFFKSAILPLMFFCVALSGCSTMPQHRSLPVIKQTPQQRSIELKQLHQWQLEGKIGFFERDKRQSASLTWQVNELENTQRLNLTTYLGINVLLLESNNGQHKIQVDGKTYRGNSLEKLINSLTGLTLPTMALTYWLKGIRFQKSDVIIYQESTQLPQKLSSFYNKELWQINYSNYKQIKGYSLATKFSIKKDDLLIKISVNKWSIYPPIPNKNNK
jgi:outer membrane lipoprotein LolB